MCNSRNASQYAQLALKTVTRRHCKILIKFRGTALALIIGILGIALGCEAPAATSIQESQPPQQPKSSPAASAAQPTTRVIQEVNVGHEVGNRIPDFELSLEDGTRVTFASLLEDDKPVFLFFMATW